MMAKVIIVGRVKRAAQMVGGKNGGKSFMACTVEVVRDSGGKQFTDYFTVNSYGRDAEGLVPALAEGVMVCADGIPGINSFEGRDGKTRTNIKIIGNILPLTGKPKAADTPAGDYDPERPPV